MSDEKLRRLSRTQAIDNHVGRRLRLVRELCGLSQNELAERLHISVDVLARYEIGAERILASRMFEAASILGVPGPWFFEDLASTVTDNRTGRTQFEIQTVELRGLIRRIADKNYSANLRKNAQNRLDEIYNRASC